MKLDVSVKNLGQIKEATFNIRPMTVITGPNGTGKSFFTKSLYSIFNVINRKYYHELVEKAIRTIQLHLETLGELVGHEEIAYIDKIKTHVDNLYEDFEAASAWRIEAYYDFSKARVRLVNTIKKEFESYLGELDKSTDKAEQINLTVQIIGSKFNFLCTTLINLRNSYSEYLIDCIQNEWLDNFQISNIKELIQFGEQQITIDVGEFFTIEIFNQQSKNFAFRIGSDFIDDVAKLSSVVFFESPAYWKVREALKSVKENQRRLQYIGQQTDDVLTGVPKYFYDLDDALAIKTKTEGVFKSATDILEKELGGEFIFKGDNLSFKDKSGREISKHLVSFGMTNLGMIQALLKHNVITEGSFIFIDEPETNLHPDWQVKLAEVLLVLAQGGVNIVITTHSSDFVKALEVKIKKLHIEVMEDFLSVHFVDVDGKLLEFESTDKMQQLIEVRELLSLAYQELYFSDL